MSINEDLRKSAYYKEGRVVAYRQSIDKVNDNYDKKISDLESERKREVTMYNEIIAEEMKKPIKGKEEK